MDHFKLHSEYQPTGDQPQAIEKLVNHYSASYCSGNGISMVTFGSIVCNKLRQPQNYIEAVDSDSIEILEGVKNREYYGRSATTIENKRKIEYGTEQELAALIYGEKGLSSLPIQDIAGEHIDTDNEYMYYYSVEFIK